MISVILFACSVSEAAVFSRTIGTVGETVFTSREAALHGMMDRLAGGKDAGPPSTGNAARREQASLLLDETVAREASAFGLDDSAEREVTDLIAKASKALASQPGWKKLGFSDEEIKRAAIRKLAARDLIRIRSESMKGHISDAEAQAYFEKNRVKFGQLPFVSFKDNIKKFLSQQQLEERLRSWFEILRRKYKVRETSGDKARA